MTKTILTAVTPHGTFTRATASRYTHVVVRESERARGAAERVAEYIQRAKAAGYDKCFASGADARWIKDGGFAVTWHNSEGAARKAADGKYVWDWNTRVLGIYPVSA